MTETQPLNMDSRTLVVESPEQTSSTSQSTSSLRNDNSTNCANRTKTFIKSRLPILKWFPKYRPRYLIGDTISGITVCLTAIPQSMAYAVLCGLTPEYGLYSSFMPGFLYVFFGSCRQMTIGPTAIVSLAAFNTCGSDNPACIILTGFYAGIFQILMGVLKLGLFVSLISDPVTIGFTAGAALTITSSQIKTLLGLTVKKGGSGFISNWRAVIENISTIKLGDTILGFTCIAILFLLQKLKDVNISNPHVKKVLWYTSLARNALIILVTSTLAYIWIRSLSPDDPSPFALTGKVKSGFPPVQLPSFTLPIRDSTNSTEENYSFWETWTQELHTGPLSVAVLSVLQNVAISKTFGSGQTIQATQEMYALGIGHIVNSFFYGIPTSGSFTRSALNNAAGVKSQFGGIVTGILILISLATLTSSLYYIPKSSLSAVIVVAVLSLIETEAIIPMWRVSRLESFVCFVTFISSLLLGMELGIVIGIVVSTLLYLMKPLRPSITTDIISLTKNQDCDDEYYILLTPEIGFSFPSVDYVRTFLFKLVLAHGDKCQLYALDCTNINGIDYTGANSIVLLIKSLKTKGKRFVLLHVKSEWLILFEAVGLDDMTSIYLHGMKEKEMSVENGDVP